MKQIILFIVFLTGVVYSQQTIQLGNLSWTIPTTPFCIYQDKSQGQQAVVENYVDIKNDSVYNYDIWYIYNNGQKGNVLMVVEDVGAIQDIDFGKTEIEKNEESEGLCDYTLFLEAKDLGDKEGFRSKHYTKSSVENELTGGMLLVFCNDRKVLEKLVTTIKSQRK